MVITFIESLIDTALPLYIALKLLGVSTVNKQRLIIVSLIGAGIYVCLTLLGLNMLFATLAVLLTTIPLILIGLKLTLVNTVITVLIRTIISGLIQVTVFSMVNLFMQIDIYSSIFKAYFTAAIFVIYVGIAYIVTKKEIEIINLIG